MFLVEFAEVVEFVVLVEVVELVLVVLVVALVVVLVLLAKREAFRAVILVAISNCLSKKVAFASLSMRVLIVKN